MTKNPTTPSGLSASAKKVWRDTVDIYEFRQDELRLLADYCYELTIIDQLQQSLEGAETIVRATHGGVQANPLFGELRMHRQTAVQLWKALALPELTDDDESVPVVSVQQNARKAANIRWNGRSNA